ncbi:MAG: transposase [Oscillospiraceae bacterium]|nr:transposase [Oscillospiraceae bacterium]
MSKKPRYYTEEFKRKIVELKSSGKTISELSEEYGMSKAAVSNWCNQYKGSGSFKTADNLTEDEKELRKLRKENKQLKMENDILKQAALILEHPKIDILNPNTAKIPKPTTKTETTKNANSKANPAPVAKPEAAIAPTPKPRALKQVDLELGIIEGKLSQLEHASKVIMSYDHKIQDIERNLSSAGFFERRKMNKEIAYFGNIRTPVPAA